MDSAKFEFTRSGKQCILWLWKGDYINLGAGIEAGVYTGGGPHWVADTSLTLNMTVTLKYEDTIIASYGANTWWATAFNPDYLNINANSLSASYVFELSNSKDVFFSLYYSNLHDSHWKFDMRNYLAFYSF